MTLISRKIAIITVRRRIVADLYLHGKTQWEIAGLCGTNQATISRDLKALRAEWLKASVWDVNELIGRELMKIDYLEQEYIAAWDRSKGRKEITATERTDAGNAQRGKASVRHEDRDGNPAFLQGIQWCIEKRCKLLGLDAPAPARMDADVVFRVIYDRQNPNSTV
jgi:predicted transcriptional regulator